MSAAADAGVSDEKRNAMMKSLSEAYWDVRAISSILTGLTHDKEAIESVVADFLGKQLFVASERIEDMQTALWRSGWPSGEKGRAELVAPCPTPST